MITRLNGGHWTVGLAPKKVQIEKKMESILRVLRNTKEDKAKTLTNAIKDIKKHQGKDTHKRN